MSFISQHDPDGPHLLLGNSRAERDQDLLIQEAHVILPNFMQNTGALRKGVLRKATAPRDEFGRYAEEFKQMFDSMHFADSRLAAKDLK